VEYGVEPGAEVADLAAGGGGGEDVGAHIKNNIIRRSGKQSFSEFGALLVRGRVAQSLNSRTI
jgi:hypothetical protein